MVTKGDTLAVELRWKEKMKITSFIRNFDSILMDDRKKGDDSAPTPIEVFLSSVGSCLIMSFIYCLYLSGVHLKPDDFDVRVSGAIGRVNNRLRLVNVKTEFLIKTKEDRVKIEKCFEKFQPFCILSESIKSGIPFTCDLKMGEKEN